MSNLSSNLILGAFVILILLPWLGGLFLTVLNFMYVRSNVLYLQQLAFRLQSENDTLRAEREQLHEEINKTTLTLQTTLVENAMLSARVTRGDDCG